MIPIPIIDGPLKGRVREINPAYAYAGFYYEYVSPTPLATSFNPYEIFQLPEPETVHYHVHRLFLLGRPIMVASVAAYALDIDTADLFEALVSDKGKAAVAP